MSKSVSATVDEPAVSEMPPLWWMTPVRSASPDEFVIGNARSPLRVAWAGAIGAGSRRGS
jgi:hypothetical protein